MQFGLKIPEFEDPVEDQSGIDLHAVFNTLRKTLVTAQIDAVVEERASLSILQFAKFGMWRDLDQHWEDLARNPLVNHLAFNPTGDFEDPVDQPAGADLDGLGMISPISADATQLHAINEAIAGRTFVLEGPPGTGKSQTITNLLAHAMREGKKVPVRRGEEGRSRSRAKAYGVDRFGGSRTRTSRQKQHVPPNFGANSDMH